MRILEFDGTAVLRIVLIVFFAVFPKIGDVIANALNRFLLAGGLDIKDSHADYGINVNVVFHSALPPIVSGC